MGTDLGKLQAVSTFNNYAAQGAMPPQHVLRAGNDSFYDLQAAESGIAAGLDNLASRRR